MTGAVTRASARRFAREDVAPAIAPWLVARALVLAGFALARYLFDQIGTGRRPDPLQLGLFARDAAFYRDIAQHGYDAVGRAGLRFFPLVPVVARGLGGAVGRSDLALLLIANLSALAFVALLHRLAMRETGDPDLARRSAWWGSLLPPALVLVLGYAEGPLLALGVGVFLALRSRRWGWAIGLGVLAGLCRPAGILLTVPAVIEVARGWRDAPGADRLRRVLTAVAPSVGTAAFLAWVGATRDDWYLPFRIQQDPTLHGGFRDPVSSLVAAAGDLGGGERFGSGLHLIWAALFVVLIVVVARRLPASYAAYAIAAVVLALSATNLDSFERYGVGTFPIAIGAALVTRRRDVESVALTLAGGAMVGYATLVFLDLYVP